MAKVDKATSTLRNEVRSLSTTRAAYDNLRDQHRANIMSDPSRLRAQLQRTASFAANRQEAALTSPVFGGQLEAATRRMRARQGIVNRGEEAIVNQNLKDRLEVVRSQMKRRGALQQGLQQAANIRQGVNIGVQNANQIIAESNADLFGGVAGVTAGILKDSGNREKIGNWFKGIFGGSKGGGGGGGGGYNRSDRRLKENLQHVGTDEQGYRWYTWDWNAQAKLLGAHKYMPMGVIAQEVQQINPDAVKMDESGFLCVNYGALS